MGCCQDKDCHTCNEEAKEAELEEVKEEGGTRDTREARGGPGRPRELELELERGKVQEVGRGRVERNSAAWSFPRHGRRHRRRRD